MATTERGLTGSLVQSLGGFANFKTRLQILKGEKEKIDFSQEQLTHLRLSMITLQSIRFGTGANYH